MAESARSPESSDSQSTQSKRCACGFWGTPETLNMCSKCYKDYLGKQGSVSPQKLEKSDPVKVSERAKEGQPSRSELDPHLPEDRPTQKNKRKCWTCKSKLELVQQQVGICRCGYVFCVLHRLPEQHQCIYNHKESGRQADLGKMVQPKKHLGRSFHRLDSQPE